MSRASKASRRRFFGQAGAALSAPLALAAAAPGDAADTQAARLAELEDREALRSLLEAYTRQVNARAGDVVAARAADPARAGLDHAVARITADGLDAGPEIRIDGGRATLRLRCVAVYESEIEPAGTLVEMARTLGEGVLRQREARVLELDCGKRDGAWTVGSARVRPV